MEHVNMFKNTKIVCTIGPASEDMKTLKKLIENIKQSSSSLIFPVFPQTFINTSPAIVSKMYITTNINFFKSNFIKFTSILILNS